MKIEQSKFPIEQAKNEEISYTISDMLKELSATFDISKSTVGRLLKELAKSGYLNGQKKDPTKKTSPWVYKKGFKTLNLLEEINIETYKDEINELVEKCYQQELENNEIDDDIDFFNDGL